MGAKDLSQLRRPESPDELLEALEALGRQGRHFEWCAGAAAYVAAGQANLPLVGILAEQAELQRLWDERPAYNAAKRAFDVVASGLLLVVLLPLLVAIAVAVKLDSPGPVIYRQLRVGRFRAPFWIWKFRTMSEGAHRRFPHVGGPERRPLAKVTEGDVITRVGRILRRYNLDELPQLVNVLRSDMSFVGPRPLSVDDTVTIDSQRLARFAVRPGITGLWQARHPVVTDGFEKVRLDVEYVERRSFALDLRLIAATALLEIRIVIDALRGGKA